MRENSFKMTLIIFACDVHWFKRRKCGSELSVYEFGKVKTENYSMARHLVYRN